ncbi:uncharacterized protein EDB91DRAFT_1089860, partial [Suillus paluster]|uniref:uncharacterized protein n=1 Tax=Suillus paluster TaxID=48578 RepID=UPI001B87E0F5
MSVIYFVTARAMSTDRTLASDLNTHSSPSFPTNHVPEPQFSANEFAEALTLREAEWLRVYLTLAFVQTFGPELSPVNFGKTFGSSRIRFLVLTESSGPGVVGSTLRVTVRGGAGAVFALPIQVDPEIVDPTITHTT